MHLISALGGIMLGACRHWLVRRSVVSKSILTYHLIIKVEYLYIMEI
jgi:hypothetical protein